MHITLKNLIEQEMFCNKDNWNNINTYSPMSIDINEEFFNEGFNEVNQLKQFGCFVNDIIFETTEFVYEFSINEFKNNSIICSSRLV